MKRTRYLILAAMAALALSGCAQKASMSLSMQATAPGGGTPRALGGASARALTTPLVVPVIGKDGSNLGNLTIEEAFAAVKDIQIELDPAQVDSTDEQAQEAELEYTGPFLVDLVGSTVNPDFPAISLLPGSYDEIELSIDKLDGTELGRDGKPLAPAGSPLLGRSIYLKGSYAAVGAASVPFTLAYDIDEGFELSGADAALPLALEGGADNPVIVAFRMRQWFDFSKAKTNPSLIVDFRDLSLSNGAIVLDGTALGKNNAVREVIEENIEESADFGEDGDGDGILSPAEDDDAVDTDDV